MSTFGIIQKSFKALAGTHSAHLKNAVWWSEDTGPLLSPPSLQGSVRDLRDFFNSQLSAYPKRQNMDKEAKFNKEMEDLYRIVGEATGYWAKYFLKSVRKHGGVSHAKKALSKKNSAQDGFQKLIEVGRPDLSMEAFVVKEEYRELFSQEEVEEAKRRLSTVPNYAKRKDVSPDENFSGEIQDAKIFKEGTTKQVTVNLHERNPAARKECLKKHGYNCKVCGMSFVEVYGEIGKNFIHVHHIKPLAGIFGDYELNPKKDLIPVCPNCHAMLHTLSPPLSIDELKNILNKNKND